MSLRLCFHLYSHWACPFRGFSDTQQLQTKCPSGFKSSQDSFSSPHSMNKSPGTEEHYPKLGPVVIHESMVIWKRWSKTTGLTTGVERCPKERLGHCCPEVGWISGKNIRCLPQPHSQRHQLRGRHKQTPVIQWDEVSEEHGTVRALRRGIQLCQRKWGKIWGRDEPWRPSREGRESFPHKEHMEEMAWAMASEDFGLESTMKFSLMSQSISWWGGMVDEAIL